MALDRPRMRPRSSRLFALMLGFLACSAARPAVAQLATPDPYDPDQAPYKGFVYPGYLSDPYLGGRALFMGGPAGANQMQNYYRGVEGGATDPRRGTGRFSRFDESYRLSDEVAGRFYQPNGDVDQAFYAAKQERDEVYFKALREKDPRKRAALMKEYEELTQKTSREASAFPRTGDSSAARPKSDRNDRPTRASNRAGSTAPPVPGLAPREPGASRGSLARAGRPSRNAPEMPILEVLGLSGPSARENSRRASSPASGPGRLADPTETLRRAQSGSGSGSAPPAVPNLPTNPPRPR